MANVWSFINSPNILSSNQLSLPTQFGKFWTFYDSANNWNFGPENELHFGSPKPNRAHKKTKWPWNSEVKTNIYPYFVKYQVCFYDNKKYFNNNYQVQIWSHFQLFLCFSSLKICLTQRQAVSKVYLCVSTKLIFYTCPTQSDICFGAPYLPS